MTKCRNYQSWPRQPSLTVLTGIISLALILQRSSYLPTFTDTANAMPFETSVQTQPKPKGPPLPRFHTMAVTCSETRIPPSKSLLPYRKSQKGEDMQLYRYFQGLCNGTYIEMGALDGVRFSNSFLFHKRFNWKGLLVELSPTNFEKLVQNRPNELANVNAGVCGRRQTLHFVEGGRNGIRVAVGGIWEHSPESFRERWWRGVDLNQTQTIECTPLVDIIQEHTPEVNYFDFLSLDVEGGEFDVIQAIDFNQVGFGILIVEADYHNHDRNVLLRNLLENRGYVFLGHNSPNNWFVNKKFSQIYRGLLNNAELNNATL